MPKHIDPARAFAASSSGAVGGRRWAQKSFKLRRMPRVGSDLTGVPVAGEENAHGRAPPARRNYYQAAHQRTSDGHATGSAELAGSSATLAAHELGPPPPQRRPNLLGMPLAPRAPAAPRKNTLASQSLSASAATMAKEQLVKTRAVYKEKLTLVKQRLKTRRRRFKRSHLNYTAAKDSPNTVKAMKAMAVPPPRQPLYFESDDSNNDDDDDDDDDNVSSFRVMMRDTLKQSRSSIQLSVQSRDRADTVARAPVLRRATTAPSNLSRRRGITPPPLDAGSYPFGKHSNDIAKRP
jgi:hypothetical protein